jgi:hypothetical protein
MQPPSSALMIEAVRSSETSETSQLLHGASTQSRFSISTWGRCINRERMRTMGIKYKTGRKVRQKKEGDREDGI